MQIKRAREILGDLAKDWSDERLHQHIDRLSVIAEIAAEEALVKFGLQKTVQNVHTSRETQNHRRLPPPVVSKSTILESRNGGL